MGKALSRTIKEVFEGKISLFKQLNDISRLLVDLQYAESSVRRNLIQPNINATVRDTLKATISDEMLFRKTLGEKIKATKEILQSSKDFKVPLKTPQAKNTKTSRARLCVIRHLRSANTLRRAGRENIQYRPTTTDSRSRVSNRRITKPRLNAVSRF